MEEKDKINNIDPAAQPNAESAETPEVKKTASAGSGKKRSSRSKQGAKNKKNESAAEAIATPVEVVDSSAQQEQKPEPAEQELSASEAAEQQPDPEAVSAEQKPGPAAEETPCTEPAAVQDGTEEQTQVSTDAAASEEPQPVDPAAIDEGTSIADSVKVISPLRMVLKRFFRSKLSMAGFIMFILLFVFSFLGPVFVSWGEEDVDDFGRITAMETIIPLYPVDPESNEEYTVYAVEIHTPIRNDHAAPFTFSNNGKLHLFGTDENGRDVFVRLMYGGRLSLLLSFLVVILYSIIGVILGGLAGYFGGWVDMIIMRIVDVLNCIPSLPILLIIGSILDGLDVDQSVRIYYMMGFLTLLSWTGVARLVRGQILYLREQEYIVATEALGFSAARKIFKHLIPNVLPQLIVSMTLGLGSVILTEASLSFLGLGVPIKQASWGQMVQRATENIDILTYYANEWLPAGIMIIIAVVSFNFIGDGLRDALDPKMKR